MATLGEMDSGGIKRAGPSIEIRTMESSHRDFDYWPSIALNSCGCLIGGKINYKDSFYPRTIAQWNDLPAECIACTSPCSFRQSL